MDKDKGEPVISVKTDDKKDDKKTEKKPAEEKVEDKEKKPEEEKAEGTMKEETKTEGWFLILVLMNQLAHSLATGNLIR